MLALATAIQTSPSVALKIAELFLQDARFPAHRPVSSPPPPPRHEITGEVDDDYYVDPDEAAAIQEQIGFCGQALASAGTEGILVAAIPEFELYAPPPDRPFDDVQGIRGCRVDLSVCIQGCGESLQLLLEAKAGGDERQERRAVADWGDEELDQPLRYAATWESAIRHDPDLDGATCRIVGTIGMVDYRAAWEELWRRHRLKGPYGPPARVACANDASWSAIRDIVGSCAETAVLVELMAET